MMKSGDVWDAASDHSRIMARRAQGRFANGLLLPMRKRDRMCETQGQGFRIN